MKTLAFTLILFLLALAASSQNRPVLNRNARLNVDGLRLQTERARLSISRERLLRSNHITPAERRTIRKERLKKHRIKRKHNRLS